MSSDPKARRPSDGGPSPVASPRQQPVRELADPLVLPFAVPELVEDPPGFVVLEPGVVDELLVFGAIVPREPAVVPGSLVMMLGVRKLLALPVVLLHGRLELDPGGSGIPAGPTLWEPGLAGPGAMGVPPGLTPPGLMPPTPPVAPPVEPPVEPPVAPPDAPPALPPLLPPAPPWAKPAVVAETTKSIARNWRQTRCLMNSPSGCLGLSNVRGGCRPLRRRATLEPCGRPGRFRVAE